MNDLLNADDDDMKEETAAGGVFKEFDCPSCTANNPMDDGFRVGEEVRCHYCGGEFEVREGGNSYKLREL
jgi:hypothetical protein